MLNMFTEPVTATTTGDDSRVVRTRGKTEITLATAGDANFDGGHLRVAASIDGGATWIGFDQSSSQYAENVTLAEPGMVTFSAPRGLLLRIEPSIGASGSVSKVTLLGHLKFVSV